MSAPDRSLHVTEPAPAPGDDAPRERYEFADTPQWPVTRLAAVLLTILLGACMVAPATFAEDHGARWLALLVPALLATVTARVLFEAIGPTRRRDIRGHIVPALGGAVLATLIISAAALMIGLPWSAPVAGATVLLAGGALVAAGLVRDLEIRVRLGLRRVYFVGSQTARRDLEHELAHRSDASFVGAYPVLGPAEPARVVEAVLAASPTVLVLDRDAMAIGEMVEAASELNLRGVQVRDLVGYYESEFQKVPLAELSPTWFLFDIAPIHRRAVRQLALRVTECALAAILLILAAPVLAVSAAVVRLTSAGPALYRQQRVGKGGIPFTLLKLRTMTSTTEPAAWAGSQAHRVTPAGQFLRRFRLDELPQLWNVVAGDLALIGPRPEQVPIVERLEREIPFYSARHSVRPGLTGWAQVNLAYAGSFEGTVAKLQRDLYYIKHSGWRLDCLILWLTVKTVVSGRG